MARDKMSEREKVEMKFVRLSKKVLKSEKMLRKSMSCLIDIVLDLYSQHLIFFIAG
jgi:hypothetical protein